MAPGRAGLRGAARPAAHAASDPSRLSWPLAVVKVSPAAGFFYPAASAAPDYAASRQTPADDLSMNEEWRPFLHAGCAAATNGSRRSLLLRFLRLTPTVLTTCRRQPQVLTRFLRLTPTQLTTCRRLPSASSQYSRSQS